MPNKPGPKPKGYVRKSLSIRQVVWRRLERLAESRGVSVSALIREIIEKEISP